MIAALRALFYETEVIARCPRAKHLTESLANRAAAVPVLPRIHGRKSNWNSENRLSLGRLASERRRPPVRKA